MFRNAAALHELDVHALKNTLRHGPVQQSAGRRELDSHATKPGFDHHHEVEPAATHEI